MDDGGEGAGDGLDRSTRVLLVTLRKFYREVTTMTRAYVVTLRDGRTIRAVVAAEEVCGVLNWYVAFVDGVAAPCDRTLYATPFVPLARELTRLDLDVVSVAEVTR